MRFNLQPELIYHIYNRGNNSQQTFLENENYTFFIKKLAKHLLPYADILAYCLMPNHFHLMVAIKGPTDVSKTPGDYQVNRAIGTILSSYTQAINKKYHRTGSLFQQKTKYKLIEEKDQARICFHYIHQNPLKAGLVGKLEDWPYSSFNLYISQNDNSILDYRKALEYLDLPQDPHTFYKESYAVLKPSDASKPSDGSPDSKTKIGLVLSGGGARGIAHLGIIKALEEHNVTFDYISGTSAGAIIGAFYSAGHSWDAILKIITDIKYYRLFRPAMSWSGLLNMDIVEDFLKTYLPENNFKALNIPLYVTATNLRTGVSEYFCEGDLRKALCASACIPLLFKPVEYNEELYIDGGILNNLPVEPIRQKCDVIIGCHTNPVDSDFKAKNFRFVMERVLMMAISTNVYQHRKACDVFFEPKGLEPYKVMDLSKAQEIFDIGYQFATNQLKEENILNKL